MIERPKGIKTFDFCILFLLPINPPEIYAVFFIGSVENVEIGINEFRVGNIKGNTFFALRVNAHKACKIFVLIFKRAYSLRRMEVDGDLEVLVVQPRKQFFVIRKKFGVPAVAGPALRLKCFCNVPVGQKTITAKECIFFSETLF